MAKYEWYKAGTGIRYRKHPTRKHGVDFDQYYVIRYQRDGKTIDEAIGWASRMTKTDREKYKSPLKKAKARLAEIEEAIRTGKGPQSLKEAREIARQERIAEAERKAEEERIGTTVEAFWADEYFPLAQQKKKPKSWKAEEGLFRLWIAPVIGTKPLASVSPFDLEKIKQNMVMGDLAPRSIEYALAVVRQLFNIAADKGVFTGQNPSKRVKAPRFDNRRERYLSPVESQKLLAELKRRSPDVHDMALLSLHCGLRAKEIFSLQWNHIDFDGGTIFVTDTKSAVNRHVPMTKTAKEMLLARRRESELVFSAKGGGKIQMISKTFPIVVEELGLNDGITDARQRICFHSLRHSYASTHAQRGESIFTIAALMGHSTIKMSERYSHHDPEKLKKTAERLEEDLNGNTGADVIAIESRKRS